MGQLDQLPTEVLWHVIDYIDTARALLFFSLACKKLYHVVEKDGYRVFTKSVFPSIKITAPIQYGNDHAKFWRDACWSLTTLSRNWDRKAFIAHRELPLPYSDGRRRQRNYQTMGFAPVIDAIEDWYSGDWRDRHHIVACGAGVQLYFRISDLGDDEHPHLPRHKPYPLWNCFTKKKAYDGPDDIMSLKLLPPNSNSEQSVMIGRANGCLEKATFNYERGDFQMSAFPSAESETRSVTATGINCMAINDDGIVAINTKGSQIAFYDSQVDSLSSHPSHHFSEKENSRARKLEFINPRTLVVGETQGIDPLVTYDTQQNVTTKINTRADCAIYSLAMLGDSTNQKKESSLFLSGGFDGVVRLHDLRCQQSDVLHFDDKMNTCAIYSLVSWGQERFVAGGASDNLLKFFDIRLPGTRKYYATNLQRSQLSPPRRESVSNPQARPSFQNTVLRTRKGWNVFIQDNKSGRPTRGPRYQNSPVYSLSKASAYSPIFYAGTENNVYEFDIVSIMDKHPDPIYGKLPEIEDEDCAVKNKWSHSHSREIMNLPMYEHPSTTSESVRLRMQRPVGSRDATTPGWDERWERE